MHELVKQKLQLFKKQKVENILAQNFVLFLCFIFSWEQTLRFRFENIFAKIKDSCFYRTALHLSKNLIYFLK
jgi:hypothetical protein